MKRYYTVVFPAGKPQASKRYRQTLAVIRKNPKAGSRSQSVDSLHEYPITNTPFTFVYQVTKTEIRIVNVKDQRSNKRIRRPA